MLRAHAEKGADRTIDVPRFKEIAGVSRKYAIPLLEYFDRERITRRSGRQARYSVMQRFLTDLWNNMMIIRTEDW